MSFQRYQIFYPEMYLLEGGYATFFQQHPDLCTGGYKPQFGDKNEKARCRTMERNSCNYIIED